MDIPFLTTEQMIEVDRAMIEEYGITLVQMMENAGRSLAVLARRRFLADDPRAKRVIVLAGPGGNGGGGMVCARRLHNWGCDVAVRLVKAPGEYRGVPVQQLGILQKMGVRIGVGLGTTREQEADLIIDALIGYSLKGAPRGEAGAMIREANASGIPVLALDAPSGLDTTTGTVYDPAIHAAATLTLALPKVGLRAGREQVGELYLADISVPPELYAGPGLGLSVGAIFAQDDVIAVDW